MGCSYASLRTNLPREIMGFSDLPFTPEAMGARSTDPRRFPRHTEVGRWGVSPDRHSKGSAGSGPGHRPL